MRRAKYPYIKLCDCGCRQIKIVRNKVYTRFISGHNARVMIRTPEHRKRISEKLKGANNHFFKSGITVDKDGYILELCYDHPKCRGNTYYVLQHVLIYERFYKCHILPWGVVHHINRNKRDNRIENLQGMTNRQHTIFHNKED